MSFTTKINPRYEAGRILLAQAIEYDEKKQSKEAINKYIQCSEQVLLGLKHDLNENSRIIMIKRVKQWIERAELLKVEEKLSKLPSVQTINQVKKQPKIKSPFDDIIGLENVKQTLREAVLLPILQPQLFVGERKPWRGILLFGPPGTGKSLLASAVSKEANCAFISVSSSDLVSKYLGDSEKAICELFNQARESVKNVPNKRCVIFFDEIDSIGRARSNDNNQKESDRRLLTELLKQMDGINQQDNSRIVVMGATNLPFELDSALRRRFEKRLYIPLPGLKARAQLIAKHLGPPGIDHELTAKEIIRLASKTRGLSGADIAALCKEILLCPVRLCLSANYFARTLDGSLVPCASRSTWAMPMKMLDKDFDAKSLRVPLANFTDAWSALDKVKPTVNPQELTTHTKFASEFGEAINHFEEEKIDDENEIIVSIQKSWGVLDQSWIGWAVSGISSTVNNAVKKILVPS